MNRVFFDLKLRFAIFFGQSLDWPVAGLREMNRLLGRIVTLVRERLQETFALEIGRSFDLFLFRDGEV